MWTIKQYTLDLDDIKQYRWIDFMDVRFMYVHDKISVGDRIKIIFHQKTKILLILITSGY